MIINNQYKAARYTFWFLFNKGAWCSLWPPVETCTPSAYGEVFFFFFFGTNYLVIWNLEIKHIVRVRERKRKVHTVWAASLFKGSWHSHAQQTKRGETGGGGGWGSKTQRIEVRQSSFSGRTLSCGAARILSKSTRFFLVPCTRTPCPGPLCALWLTFSEPAAILPGDHTK